MPLVIGRRLVVRGPLSLRRHGQRTRHRKEQSKPLVTHKFVLHFFEWLLPEIHEISTHPTISRIPGSVRSHLLPAEAKHLADPPARSTPHPPPARLLCFT